MANFLAIYLLLYLIFKSSINSAKISKQWKFARVSAIYFKEGNRKLAYNYRPVNITSILFICRILETIIRNSF